MSRAYFHGSTRLALAIPGAIILALAINAKPAAAQALSSGDYELCSVYDRDGNFSGHDSVCLERKRSQLRRLKRDKQLDHGERVSNYIAPSATYTPTVCPGWANSGMGYSSTVNPPAGSFGPYDSMANGRPCIANPVTILPGMP